VFVPPPSYLNVRRDSAACAGSSVRGCVTSADCENSTILYFLSSLPNSACLIPITSAVAKTVIFLKSSQQNINKVGGVIPDLLQHVAGHWGVFGAPIGIVSQFLQEVSLQTDPESSIAMHRLTSIARLHVGASESDGASVGTVDGSRLGSTDGILLGSLDSTSLGLELLLGILLLLGTRLG